MDSNTTQNTELTGKVAPEFGTWPVTDSTLRTTAEIRTRFDDLLSYIANHVPQGNERYLAIVKTKLEESCMFAVKAVAKSTN